MRSADKTKQQITWKGKKDLSELSGRTIRAKFYLAVVTSMLIGFLHGHRVRAVVIQPVVVLVFMPVVWISNRISSYIMLGIIIRLYSL